MKIVNASLNVILIAMVAACACELPKAMDREVSYNEYLRQRHCVHYLEMCKKMADNHL